MDQEGKICYSKSWCSIISDYQSKGFATPFPSPLFQADEAFGSGCNRVQLYACFFGLEITDGVGYRLSCNELKLQRLSTWLGCKTQFEDFCKAN